MALVKGFRTSLRVKGSYGTMKCTAFWGPMRLRVALLMCIILTCSASLVTFHYLLVTWGDCVEFGEFHSTISSDPHNLRRSPHWDYFDHIYVLHSHLAVEREADIHASINQLHLENDIEMWDTDILILFFFSPLFSKIFFFFFCFIFYLFSSFL